MATALASPCRDLSDPEIQRQITTLHRPDNVTTIS
jgi:hypothetical protein